MPLRFVSVQAVIALHKQQLALSPAEPDGVHDFGALESAVLAPHNHHFYGEVTDVHWLAAIYVVHLARNHPFRAGNKRTAMATCVAFLNLNGHSFTRTDEEFGKLIISVLEHKADVSEVASFLQSNTVSHA